VSLQVEHKQFIGNGGGVLICLLLVLCIPVGLWGAVVYPPARIVHDDVVLRSLKPHSDISDAKLFGSGVKNVPVLNISKENQHRPIIVGLTHKFLVQHQRSADARVGLVRWDGFPKRDNFGVETFERRFPALLRNSHEMETVLDDPRRSFPVVLERQIEIKSFRLKVLLLIGEIPQQQPRPLTVDNGLSANLRGFSSFLCSIGSPPCKDGLPDENHHTDQRAYHSEDGCLHITPRERIERIGLCLFFFALALWLFYYKAGKELVTGHVLWFAGNCLLGFACFILCVEFADSASAFGCSGWRSIWRNFLCAYGEKCGNENNGHGDNNVTQKLLTMLDSCNTLITVGRSQMANILSTDKQSTIIGLLAEGSSIRSIERVTGVHRDTIMRLGVRVGKGCQTLLDHKMRDLPCKQLQFDEIWGFIGKKERHVRPDDNPELGDVWTFCAIDSDTKLVPAFKCGKRDLATANAFVGDIASRLRNRVQISSDALRAYVDAIEMNFGADVDFAQIIKTYVTDDSHIPERRFSAPEIVITEKKTVTGFPDLRLASTSHIERLNGTTRLHMRRLTRLTYAFSKKLENFEAAVALHFAYYNFVKRHITLRATPAMAAGIEKDFWTVGQLLEAV
jgi:IS1 family transposase